MPGRSKGKVCCLQGTRCRFYRGKRAPTVSIVSLAPTMSTLGMRDLHVYPRNEGSARKTASCKENETVLDCDFREGSDVMSGNI
eukprot:148717-Rhodomonas_salina.1